MINTVVQGDCCELLKKLPDNSIDSVITDPPYELGFMGKEWDRTGIANNIEMWAEVLRVLKPGGHLLAFGGSRNYHRMACAIESAGFEVENLISWIYGTGFPKSMDISKAIDKHLGAEREVVGKRQRNGGANGMTADKGWNAGPMSNDDATVNITSPATPEAQQWEGWGTSLKPATEPICLARKPLSEKIYAANVLKWGTGGLNIDACRIPMSANDADVMNRKASKNPTGEASHREGKIYGSYELGIATPAHMLGRFPANVLFDEEAAAELDEQSGVSKSSGGRTIKRSGGGNVGSGKKSEKVVTSDDPGYGDVGGASRFFYVAKASKKDRGDGNDHQTVKPTQLMRYLCRLVTPPGGIVLDPFAGSGSTLVAAKLEGFNYVGMELKQEYVEIAKKRLERAE